VLWRCFGGALAVLWRCFGGALAVHWRCVGGAIAINTIYISCGFMSIGALMPFLSHLLWIAVIVVALQPASIAVMSPRFEDASSASDFGSSLNINAPWAGMRTIFG
jgi:hypothetical protein